MTSDYTPPFTITTEITNLVIEIAEMVGHLTSNYASKTAL